jgi:hypothetical protein
MTRTASEVAERQASFFFVSAACVASWLGAGDALAADKTSLACIRAAEDGQAARDGGQLMKARELFAACAARECPSVLRRDCSAWLEDARHQTPSVVVVARDTAGRDVVDAQVTIDGTLRQPQLDGTPIELDPGQHVLRVETAGSDPQEERFLLPAGDKNHTINVTFARPKPASPLVVPPPTQEVPVPKPLPPSGETQPPEQSSRGVPAGSYVLGAIGVGALGVFGYFGIRGMLDADHLKQTCVPACQTSDVDAVRTKLLIADIALGAGVVSLAAATWFAVRGLSAPSRSSWDVRVAPRVGGATGSVVVRF